jgi:hypothetical protein
MFWKQKEESAAQKRLSLLKQRIFKDQTLLHYREEMMMMN